MSLTSVAGRPVVRSAVGRLAPTLSAVLVLAVGLGAVAWLGADTVLAAAGAFALIAVALVAASPISDIMSTDGGDRSPAIVDHCSFCGKIAAEVEHIIAGPGVYICNECVGICDLILAKKPTPPFPSLDDKTDDELILDMARIAGSRDQVEEAVIDRVQTLRGRGVTWARIGESLGMTRQSAWERFSTDSD